MFGNDPMLEHFNQIINAQDRTIRSLQRELKEHRDRINDLLLLTPGTAKLPDRGAQVQEGLLAAADDAFGKGSVIGIDVRTVDAGIDGTGLPEGPAELEVMVVFRRGPQPFDPKYSRFVLKAFDLCEEAGLGTPIIRYKTGKSRVK